MTNLAVIRDKGHVLLSGFGLIMILLCERRSWEGLDGCVRLRFSYFFYDDQLIPMVFMMST